MQSSIFTALVEIYYLPSKNMKRFYLEAKTWSKSCQENCKLWPPKKTQFIKLWLQSKRSFINDVTNQGLDTFVAPCMKAF